MIITPLFKEKCFEKICDYIKKFSRRPIFLGELALELHLPLEIIENLIISYMEKNDIVFLTEEENLILGFSSNSRVIKDPKF